MGLIERARWMHGAALDRVCPQRIVFHHVPKCGGTSVGRALRKRYLLSQGTVTPEESFRAFADATARTDREAMLVDVLDLREAMLLYLMHHDVRGIAAHVRFSDAAHSRFADRYAFVTLLRDPVSRFLSHYDWSHNRPGAHAHIPEDFDAFLETPRAARMGAIYAEYFSGLPKEADMRSGAAVARAVANLGRFDVVGRLDDLPGFGALLQDRLGLRLRIGHENRTPKPAVTRRDALSADQRRKVEALCAPDTAVWEGAMR